jgi:hypothetical protein
LPRADDVAAAVAAAAVTGDVDVDDAKISKSTKGRSRKPDKVQQYV